MTEIIQRQDPPKFPSNIIGNESQLPSCEEKNGAPSRTNRKDNSKSTGPRTPQGKGRSKFNACKHGLLSKDFLLKSESSAEYNVLINGLIEDFQPQGKLETVLVESLATVLWRKRRLLQEETAEIEKAQFLLADLILQNEAGDLEYAQLGAGPNLKLGQSNLPILLRNAMQLLGMLHQLFAAGDPQDADSIRRRLNRLYGSETEDPQPYSRRQMSLFISKLVSETLAKRHDSEDQPDPKKIALEAFCQEIMRLAMLLESATRVEGLKREHNLAGTRIASQDVSERLVRYEAHFSREMDRILNRLERLQRIRKGQPLPPQVDVKIS